MRKLLLILAISLFGYSSLWAQGIEVVGFRLLETDLTANTRGTMKKDQNGETAALIKIVSPEKGFVFNGGSLGIVGTEDHVGETWLYLPRRAQKLTITHPKFGVKRDYYYPISVEGGKTYEMLLDIGTGRYVTITTTRANSDVTIDGEYVGKAPIYSRYMNFGQHTVFAKNARYEGTLTFDVLPNDDKNKQRQENVKMRDMSDHYGEVTITVENDAEIYFNNRLMGNGTWKTELREGSYFVDTKKVDCDSARTNFTVVAQKKNEIKATPPTPHTGYLRLVTRPSDAEAIYYGTRHLSVEEPNVLPIGTYQVDFSKKGYVTRSAEYNVSHNATTTDTIILERIKYVKPLAFYFGVAYTLRSLSGVTGILGAVIKGHDIQAHYTFGMSASDPINSYTNDGNDDYLSTISFKQSSFGLKYGYQFLLMDKAAITPQVGVSIDRLTGTVESGTNLYADGASATCASVGAKFLYAPFQNFYLFAAPEFNIAVQKDANYQKLADASNISAGGFAANIGIIVNF
ncbi:MAG: PEGA domain-containing protein [Prevotella sp.]|nr:PEGA domain-containing protein [Prevotella sp.]